MVKYNNDKVHAQVHDRESHGICDGQRWSQRLSWMEGVTEL